MALNLMLEILEIYNYIYFKHAGHNAYKFIKRFKVS